MPLYREHVTQNLVITHFLSVHCHIAIAGTVDQYTVAFQKLEFSAAHRTCMPDESIGTTFHWSRTGRRLDEFVA